MFFKNDLAGAIDLGVEKGYGRFWFVWWNIDIGWYGFKAPDSFQQVYDAGRISVYELSL